MSVEWAVETTKNASQTWRNVYILSRLECLNEAFQASFFCYLYPVLTEELIPVQLPRWRREQTRYSSAKLTNIQRQHVRPGTPRKHRWETMMCHGRNITICINQCAIKSVTY